MAIEPAFIADDEEIKRRACQHLACDPAHTSVRIVHRSVDARKTPVYRVRVQVISDEEDWEEEPLLSARYQEVSHAAQVVIVGAGPAGYFAALECLVHGRKPIILERGKDVQTRRRDLRQIQQQGLVNPDSNYCFGEGGAGTYSDGKLYTRSKKRGRIRDVLQTLVEHGADPNILIDAHPHIGSNKLPRIIANIRATIEHYGGEVKFKSRVTGIDILDHKVTGVQVEGGEQLRCSELILATGHSARDVFQLLSDLGIRLEAKPFALGVRIEHPQSLIDEIQYNQRPRDPNLPAAAYRLSTEVDGRGVFSFCMCPGGLIVPTATAPGEIVTNGMSLSRRDSPFANAGFVVSVGHENLMPYHRFGALQGLEFQKQIEQSLWTMGDGSQKAPAQRLVDFLAMKESSDLPGSSYIPGLFTLPLHLVLPQDLYACLTVGLKEFGRRMRGFISAESLVVAPESRTSSPIRIPRDPKTLMHPEVKGLYPCGEGAGYAGGIMSAALDGQMIVRQLNVNV